MFKLSLRDLRAHLGRYILTFIAVAIGVAFISGVTTLTDTISRTFDDLFQDVNAGTDAAVRGKEQFDAGAFGGGAQRPRIDGSVVDDVAQVDGVAEAEAFVQGYTRLIDKTGEPVGDPNFGAPTFGASWGTVDQLNPFNLVEGSAAPSGPDEIVLDKGSADSTGYEVGDTATYQSPKGPGEATVVGIARFGTADSPFGASFVLYDLETAEDLLAEPGKVDQIGIVADEGLSQAEVRDRVADALNDAPDIADADQLEVVTGATLTEENTNDAQEGFDFFRIFLLVFALIALVVGGFVIYTSFSFIVAQRQRQVALLRAIGASRRQVLWSIILESLVVGLAASLVGYLLGVGLAALLSKLFAQDTDTSLVISPGTVALALIVGTLVTAASAFFPAWRSSKVPPVAAMRDVAIDVAHRSRLRLVLGLVVAAAGVVALIGGLRGAGIQAAGLGVFLVFAALVILGPIAARPAASVLGSPLPPLRGIVGRLAQQNALRNPKRTSATASALMIGLGIVTLVFVINASIRASIDDLVDDRFTGDFVIDSGGGFEGGGLPGSAADEVNALPEVERASGIRFARVEIDGAPRDVGGFDPDTAFELFDVGVAAGDVSGLDENGLAVFDETAKDHNWSVGDCLDVVFGETGPHLCADSDGFEIVALLDSQDLTGAYVMGKDAFDANIPDSGDMQIWVQLRDGVSVAEARPALEGIVDQFPTAELQDLSEFKSATKAQFNPFLLLINALLGLTILIAMIGIVNTLILSVAERTREIGLTRAVGATRGQVRSSIRWEALLIAAFGVLAALGVGVFFGWVLVDALKEQGFTSFRIPFVQLIVVTLVTGALTLVAALLPAAWAGRRKILTAIATE